MTTPAGEIVRAFIAIELPAAVKTALGQLQQRLQARIGQGKAVRWVSPEGIHLTLKFLGNVEVSQMPLVEDALRRAVQGVAAESVLVSGLGMFPAAAGPRVIWVGIEGDVAALQELRRRVDTATVPLGFPSEQRGFSPHLTLARVPEDLRPADRRALGAIVVSERFEAHLSVPVREVSLMRSLLSRAGAKYSRLAAFSLVVG